MSITVVDFDERIFRHQRFRMNEDPKYPPINIRDSPPHSLGVNGMYVCVFAGSTVVSNSRSKVEALVKEIIDRMRSMGMYVDPYRAIG
jgi:hypothetical protein